VFTINGVTAEYVKPNKSEEEIAMKTMINKMGAILSVVTAFTIMMTFAVSVAGAQQKMSSSAEQLIGLWTLVSATNEQDGKITEPFGPNPKGLFIYDRSGRYAVLQFKADIPKFSSNSRDKGTPEENKAVVLGSNAHFGTYTVNEKEGSFTLRPEAGTFPNWVGIDQKRSFSISNDVLMITNPSGSIGGTSKLILKRAK
jgi:hypothetical protein